VRLEGRSIAVRFGGLIAVDGVDIELERREILGVIGPNGAGKTTLMNVLSGFLRPTRGRVALSGNDMTGYPAHRLARQGVNRTFQNVRLFPGMSVSENIEVGALGMRASRSQARRKAGEIAEELGLVERLTQAADALPHGEERLVSIARALATDPDFLLLDEPAAGLNEAETDRLGAALKRVRDAHFCGLLVIEHDMRLIMDLCERIHVLDHGRTLRVGTVDEVRADPDVIAAYLGTDPEPNQIGHAEG
jgi:branched-chain amino acid transport system ATP-binding protein